MIKVEKIVQCTTTIIKALYNIPSVAPRARCTTPSCSHLLNIRKNLLGANGERFPLKLRWICYTVESKYFCICPNKSIIMDGYNTGLRVHTHFSQKFLFFLNSNISIFNAYLSCAIYKLHFNTIKQMI